MHVHKLKPQHHNESRYLTQAHLPKEIQTHPTIDITPCPNEAKRDVHLHTYVLLCLCLLPFHASSHFLVILFGTLQADGQSGNFPGPIGCKSLTQKYTSTQSWSTRLPDGCTHMPQSWRPGFQEQLSKDLLCGLGQAISSLSLGLCFLIYKTRG